MIALLAFLDAINRIVQEKPSYKLGFDGRNGYCDCIGLIIGALRRAGGKWTGTHGSNWAARNAMVSMGRSPRLELGAIMYKAREPGEAGYSLPASYSGHPDRRDYYHVGVVTSVNPLRITHCTSWSGGSGIKVDTALGRWLYGGRAKGIDYEEVWGMEPVDTASVFAANGKSVRMRVNPDTGSSAIANVPIGTEVAVLERQNDWWRISTGGKTGWMMSKFLDGRESAQTPEPIDRLALLTELEGLNVRQAAIIRALKEVDG